MRNPCAALLCLAALSSSLRAVEIVEMKNGRLYQADQVSVRGDRLLIRLRLEDPRKRAEFSVPVAQVVPECVYYAWVQQTRPDDVAELVRLAAWARTAGIFSHAAKAYGKAAEASPGTMVAVLGAPTDAVAASIAPVQDAGGQVWIANENAPDQTVLAGDEAGIAQARDACAALGKVVALAVGGAFHSPLMAPAEPALQAALQRASYADGATGAAVTGSATTPRSRVRWRARSVRTESDGRAPFEIQ